MRLEEFGALDAEAAAALVASCAAVPSWARAVVDARPYADVDALRAHADALARSWSEADIEAALADHPRIGEQRAGDGASAAHSRREQGGVDADDADVRRRLEQGNRDYEQRFGRVFLVRAAGCDAAAILDLLEQRLAHDPATERAVTAQQLREIAALRLAGLVT